MPSVPGAGVPASELPSDQNENVPNLPNVLMAVGEAEVITENWHGSSFSPQFDRGHSKRIFFLSDRGSSNSLNVWSMPVVEVDETGGAGSTGMLKEAEALQQHTFHEEFDVEVRNCGGASRWWVYVGVASKHG